MDFPVFLNKWIIGFKPIKYTVFWFWYRYVNHSGWRLDDYQRWEDFWLNLNRGWTDMNYVWEFEKFWGKGSYPPERIVLPQKDFDALVERLNEPPDPEVQERFRKLLERKAPWDDDYEQPPT